MFRILSKINSSKICVLTVFLLLLFNCLHIQAQITNSTSNGRNSSETVQKQYGEKRVTAVLERSGKRFNEGLRALQDNRRDLARENFDKSVEEFLLSDINVQSNKDLRLCYNQLIETVYRMEFPKATDPVNIRRLSTICNWRIKNETADDIAKLVLPVEMESFPLMDLAMSRSSGRRQNIQTGFSSQEFEPSRFDELSKLRQTKRNTSKFSAGTKPSPLKNGRYALVVKYIYDTFNDPYSVKYLEWTKPILVKVNGATYWRISLKLRAKNLYNAYRLSRKYFYVKNGKVRFSSENIKGTRVREYGRPSIITARVKIKRTRVVKARKGDTVQTIAKRYKVKAVDVAKLNGLFVSSRLNKGREIRIPVKR